MSKGVVSMADLIPASKTHDIQNCPSRFDSSMPVIPVTLPIRIVIDLQNDGIQMRLDASTAR